MKSRDNILKIGKVPEKILNQLVFEADYYKREEVLQGPLLGEDCAAIQLPKDEIFILSTDPITATEENIGYLAVHITLNDLAAAGAEPIGLLVTILMPPKYSEKKLKNILEELQHIAKEKNLAILGGHTEVTDAVNRVVLSITGVGRINKEKTLINKKIKAGDSIVMTKYAGLEGTSILAKAKYEELSQEFNHDFIQKAQNLDQLISVLPEAKIAINHPEFGLKAMHDVTEGGVLGALWELTAKAHKGVVADLEEIPILRETIEITEYFDINPYKLISSGAMLMIAEDGIGLVELLNKENIPAKVIGQLTDSSQKIVKYAGVEQSLGAPVGDELYKIL